MTRTNSLAAILICLVFAREPAYGGRYVFTKIADQTTVPGALAFGQDPDDGPTINDNGDVVYFVDLGSSSEIVFNSKGVESVLAQDLPFASISPVNSGGTVAVTNWTSLVTVGAFQSSIPAQYDRLLNGVINDQNDVAFRGRFDGTGPDTIFLASGGTISPLSPNLGLPAAINNAGQVALLEVFGSGTVTDGSTTTTIVNAPSDPNIGNVTGPITMNEAGEVAFRGGLTGGGFGIVVGDGGLLTVFADSLGDFDVIGKLNINDIGEIAFRPTIAGGTAIYIGRDPIADRVIGAGDPLLGTTVVRVEMRDGPLNNAGQIVFHARTTTNGEGIYVATPVPEPGGALIAISGVILLTTWRRQRD